MTPGPKKKGRQYKTGDKYENSANVNKGKVKKNNDDSTSEAAVASVITAKEEDSRYKKGVITSNWQKYDEPVVDAHAEVSRGRNFDELLSNCRSAGSQLQLQDEKTWDEDNIGGDFVLDMNRLASACKCIPLHKQLHLPEDLFDFNQIVRFQKCANNNLSNFQSALKLIPNEQKVKNESGKLIAEEQLDFLHIGKDWDVNAADVETTGKPILAAETGNLIESLTSCLSLKDNIELVNETELVQDIPDHSTKDNLDFLLALSSSHEHSARTEDKKINVDEWLDNILDS